MFKKCIVFALTIAMTASFAACTQPETITTTVPGATSTITKTTTVPGETVTTTVPGGNVTQTVTHHVTTTVIKTTTVEPESFIFTDSLGRLVEVPSNITKVAMSGPLTQIVLFPLCPDKLVGLATTWSAEAEEFIPTEYYNLPILGALYGGEDLNVEEVAATGAQIIIDIGEKKANIVDDMDSLQNQIGIPTVHIDANTDTMGDCYRMLGELLGMETEAAALADYCDEVYAEILEIADTLGTDGKVNMLYVTGNRGLNVIAHGSYHSEIIDLLCNNLAVVDNPSGKGTGNEVDMEQLILWNPDVIIFAPDSYFSAAAGDSVYSTLTAIANGNYYEVPFGPYNWMGQPPSVQRYLGMIWMSQLLYPDVAQYDVYEEVSRYYSLFYHTDITQEQFNRLTANSLGKQ